MSDVHNAAPGGGEGDSAPITVVTPADANASFSSPTSAAKALAELRWNKHKEKQAAEVAPVEAAPEAPQELAQEANAAPPEEAPSEVPQEAEPAELPPIEPPRSWTKEEKDRFQSLPRETQEYIAQREQEREREVRRSQNEAADQRKAIEAERQKAEQVSRQLEATLKAAMDVLEREHQQFFPDIKSFDDVERLSREARRIAATDPVQAAQINAYLGDWHTHQQKMQYVAWEKQQAEQRRNSEEQQKSVERKQRETKLFIERHPEFSDAKRLEATQREAREYFTELGFGNSDTELLNTPLLDDHRFQTLAYDALRWRAAQKAKNVAVQKPVPPVQRPGVAKPQGSAQSEQIQALQAKLERTGSLKDAQALRAAQMKSARRA